MERLERVRREHSDTRLRVEALIAILRAEPEAETIAVALAAAQAPRISAANYLETAIVIDASRDPIASRHVDELFTKAGLVIEPVTAEQAAIARARVALLAQAVGVVAEVCHRRVDRHISATDVVLM
ncbi:MAG: PIN domain-containing protein [Pseudonocardiaceae bacterium]